MVPRDTEKPTSQWSGVSAPCGLSQAPCAQAGHPKHTPQWVCRDLRSSHSYFHTPVLLVSFLEIINFFN